ncbi:MAG: alpha/beta hydrolase [Actinobacteria bacterium]|nr:alpha/beta hydrolase [Actinomycetota bacterium]
MSRIALLHSPLLGPSSWARVAEVLRQRGYEVAVPDLRQAVASPPYGQRFAEVAAKALGSANDGVPWVLVGHSGAGRLLAVVALGVETERLVFVDAGLPGEPSHLATAPGGARLHAFSLADDSGILPPWPDWWPAEVLAQILPDEGQRQALRSDSPRVPFNLLIEPLPQAEPRVPCAYLAFTYETEWLEARRRGWPTAALAGGHLHQMVAPAEVAEAIETLVRDGGGAEPGSPSPPA